MIKDFHSETALREFVQTFHRDGFVLIPGLINPEALKTWAQAFEPLLHEHLRTQGDPSFRGVQRFYVTLPFKAPFADPTLFNSDLLYRLMEEIAGKDFVMCQLATDTPLLGSDYQDLHADTPPLFPELELDTPSYQLAVNFPLCEVTLENGPTEIARGTHRMPKHEALRKIADGEIKVEPIPMKLGDVMIRDVRGIHRGSPNKTEVPRPMVVIGYSRKWLNRPEVSIQIPKAEWAKLSPRTQHMLRNNPIVDSLTDNPLPETYKAFAY